MTGIEISQEIHALAMLGTAGLEGEIETVRFSNRSIGTRPVWLAGPWIGELGVSLIRWIPYLRGLRAKCSEIYLIAGGYRNYASLYADFADEYWVLPERFKQCFLNRETSYNYGTFHEFFGNIEYRFHAQCKGLGLPVEEHRLIGLSWLRMLESRSIVPDRLILRLEDAPRRHYTYQASERWQQEARLMLSDHRIDIMRQPIVCVLPRMRKLQPERSWSRGFYDYLFCQLDQIAHDIGIVILGSRAYEEDLIEICGRYPSLVNAIAEDNGFDLQLAFWEVADAATGPPSGGLVMAYLLGISLIHWFKPGHFPTRHGIPWNVKAEADYTAISGVCSSWLAISDNYIEANKIVQQIKCIRKRSHTDAV